LGKSPFNSVCSIAEALLIAYPIVFLHLHDCIGFKTFYLHEVPHILTYGLCEKWREYARQMLPVLYAAECDGWHRFVTDDES
jgi:hypothetical protein